MLLSIGMIVKNEEKYLERCLTAIKPILEKVDSELIIADTGSTDNTVEIAKKFTDKVYYFEWINDFSAARNFTMEKSVGEWFMFLDADEIFQSCDEIIDFFNLGEYKDYGNAAYRVRSYNDEADLSEYIDSYVTRFAKRYPDVKFENKIHEALSPLHDRMKMLTVIADHYGYVFENNGELTEQAWEKSKRNLNMLLQSLDEPKVDFNVYKEIADCYNIIGEKEKALEYVDKGLEVLDHSHIAINQYYSLKAVLLMVLKRYSEAIPVCNEYFGSENMSRHGEMASDMDMYAIRGESYFRLGEYDEALGDFREFFRVHADYKNNKLNTIDLLFNQLKVKDRNIKYIYLMLLKSCIQTQEFDIADEYLKKFDVSQYQNDKAYMLEYFRDRAEIMEHIGWKSVKKFTETLDDENKKAFFGVLRRRMFYTDRRSELLKLLSDFTNDVPCADDVVGIYRSAFVSSNLKYEQLKKFTDNYGSDGNEDILLLMLSCGMDISDYLTAGDFSAEECAHKLYADFSDKMFLLDEYDVDMLVPEAVAKAASLYGWAMVEALRREENIVGLFEQFGKISAKWQNEFPNEEKIPGDIRAGIMVHRIAEARTRKDFHTCIDQMRMLIKVCPDFAPFVAEYRKVIEQEAMPQKDAHSELMEMAEIVKKNIRAMLDAGDISSAEKTLFELEKLCPADAEIGILKYNIKMRKTFQ